MDTMLSSITRRASFVIANTLIQYYIIYRLQRLGPFTTRDSIISAATSDNIVGESFTNILVRSV